MWRNSLTSAHGHRRQFLMQATQAAEVINVGRIDHSAPGKDSQGVPNPVTTQKQSATENVKQD